MSNYEQIKAAIQKKKCMTGMYSGLVRHFSPHEIGMGGKGLAMVMAFQYAGQTSNPKGLPDGGEWRCMEVDKFSNLVENEDEWHSRDDHSRPNYCVVHSDVVIDY